VVYLLWLWRNVFHGPITKPENQNLPDLNGREKWLVLAPVVIAMFAIGVYPRWLLKPMEPSVLSVAQKVKTAHVAHFGQSGKSPLVRLSQETVKR
jgi:NADH-quinone oxidoreductase subunit M